MSTTSTPSASPGLDAPEALQRVLALIKHSDGIQALTADSVGDAMGTPLQAASDGSGRYGFGESIDGQWSYGVSLDTSKPDTAAFEFSFNPSSANAAMTSICQLDYDAFAAALEAMGFSRTPYAGEHGRFVKEWFDRPGLRVSVYPQGESDQAANHRCVRMVTIP